MSTESLFINVDNLNGIMANSTSENLNNISDAIFHMTTFTNNVSHVSNVTDVLLTEEELLLMKLGAKSQDTLSAVILLTIYGLIFVSGTIGNICTCVVIARNSYMQTTTNYYLFSLAISDVIILFLGKFNNLINFEQLHEKTNNLGFRPGPTQTDLYNHRSKLKA